MSALKQVVKDCDICPQIGRPLPSCKISLTRVSSDFNTTVHVDYMFIVIRDKPLVVSHMVDSNTAYSAACLVPSRDLLCAARKFESAWIHVHGAPSSVAADPEFSRAPFQDLLQKYFISFARRPARRHQKTGCVERKNGVLRPILYRIALADKEAPPELIVSIATFCSNSLFGSRTCSSFELARGYTPSFGPVPQTIVHPEVVDAYHEKSAHRAIHRVLTSAKIPFLHSALLPSGTRVWAFMKESSGIV
jgi:hypothetical protein